MGERFGSVVVLGASIAGCCAAKAMANDFHHVYLVERDALSDTEAVRNGTPQANHFHGLQARGHLTFEELFPGFTEDVLAGGAALLSNTWDVVKRSRLGLMSPRYPSNHPMLGASRGLIESTIRKRVLELPNVHLLEGVSAQGPITDETGRRVTGVRLAGQSADAPSELRADLVVDATGRLSRAPQWFEELGFAAPRETAVDAHWSYTSCWVKVPRNWQPGFRALLAIPVGGGATGPISTRGGAMWEQDGDRRWIVTALGVSGEGAPTDETGFRAYLESVGLPELTRAIADVEIDGKIRTWRRTVNRLRHFEELKTYPDRFVVVGDAVAAFNPVYGQGMAVAGLAAADLREEVARARGADSGLDGLAKRFQDQLAERIAFPWSVSTGSDYQRPGVEGEPQPAGAAQASAFSDRVEALSLIDLDINLRLTQTIHMIRSPEWLASENLRNRVLDSWDELGAIAEGKPSQTEPESDETDYRWLAKAVASANLDRVSIFR